MISAGIIVTKLLPTVKGLTTIKNQLNDIIVCNALITSAWGKYFHVPLLLRICASCNVDMVDCCDNIWLVLTGTDLSFSLDRYDVNYIVPLISVSISIC